MGSTRPAADHVLPLKDLLANPAPASPAAMASDVRILTCESTESECSASVSFQHTDRVLQFMGRPPSVGELLAALA